MFSKVKIILLSVFLFIMFSCGSDEISEENSSVGKSSNVAPGLESNSGSSSGSKENVFRINFSDPPTFDPHLVTDTTSASIIVEIFSGLVTLNKDLDIIPDLAESWSISEDAKVFTFNIRKNAKWHDGKSFTSDDVAFTVMNVLKKFHPRGPNSFREVTSIDTPDSHTAIFNLRNPAPYMLRALSAYESPIVPKHLLEGTDIKSAKLGNNPVGTGPFKFVEWKKGQYVRLDKNKNYWRPGLPYLDRVVGRFVPDASTRTAAMENGEVLYAAYNAVPNIDAVRLKERDDISVTTDGYSMINPVALIEFNAKEGPFANTAVRRAISLLSLIHI